MLEHLDTLIAFAVVMLLLSLLITVIVQAVVSVLGLRSRQLRTGMVTLLRQLYPNLGDGAETLAEKVLAHPALCHLGFTPATAIRARELVLVLEQLASRGELDASAKQAVDSSMQRTAGSGSPEMIAKAQEIVALLEKEFPAQAVKVREVVESALGSTQEVVVKIDAWFETVMDRTSERFKIWTRWITAIAAFSLAIGLQVDSLAILDQLWSDPELRAEIAGMRESVVGRAEAILARREAGEALHALANAAQPSPVRDAAQALCPGAIAACAGQATTCAEGTRWLRTQNASQELLTAFGTRCAQVVATRLEGLRDETRDLRTAVESTGLEIFFARSPNDESLRILGVLMTGVFLSLGAPFWYNSLRRLSDLRPIVARNVEQDEK